MSLKIVTPPASEPLSLAEGKLYLRVDHDAEDALIADLIGAAREAVEAYCGRALITRRMLETRDAWAFDERGAVALTGAPASAVHAVRVVLANGGFLTLDAGGYALDAAHDPPLLIFHAAPLAPARPVAGIEIEYDAGYGPSASALPEALRQAVRLTLAAAYEDRAGAVALPAGAKALAAPFRVVRL